jgi:hypothetical protein
MDVVASVDFLHKNLVEISRGVFAHCRHDISISRSVGMYILFSCVPDEKDILCRIPQFSPERHCPHQPTSKRVFKKSSHVNTSYRPVSRVKKRDNYLFWHQYKIYEFLRALRPKILLGRYFVLSAGGMPPFALISDVVVVVVPLGSVLIFLFSFHSNLRPPELRDYIIHVVVRHKIDRK